MTENKKLLVAFTSCGDELLFMYNHMDLLGYSTAQHPKPFLNQIEWLKCLVNHAEESEDLELIVRIHPREGTSGRYSSASAHLALLLEEFKREFKNTRFVWPDEKISSYDLMEIADVGLTSWSTIGVEMARLGVPVVTAFRNITFPDDDFLKWGGNTPDDYVRTVRERFEWQPSLESLARAYRAYYAYRLGPTISFNDIIPHPDFREMPDAIPQASESETLEKVFMHREDILNINRQRLRNQSVQAKDLEKRRAEL